MNFNLRLPFFITAIAAIVCVEPALGYPLLAILLVVFPAKWLGFRSHGED